MHREQWGKLSEAIDLEQKGPAEGSPSLIRPTNRERISTASLPQLLCIIFSGYFLPEEARRDGVRRENM